MPSGPNPAESTPDRPRRRVAIPFLIVFLGGFALIAARSLFGEEGLAMESVVPLLGGAAMAAVVAWLVVRERTDRAESRDDAAPPP